LTHTGSLTTPYAVMGAVFVTIGLTFAVYGRFRQQGQWLTQGRFIVTVLTPMVLSAMGAGLRTPARHDRGGSVGRSHRGAFWISLFVNVNHFSMHALYRNRLIRAFLGAARSAGPIPSRDSIPMTTASWPRPPRRGTAASCFMSSTPLSTSSRRGTVPGRSARRSQNPPCPGLRFAIGHIAYPGSSKPGWLLYLKPTYQGTTERADVRSYASGHPTFPHESTTDQWFSESQLESYRALGASIAEYVCSGGQGVPAVGTGCDDTAIVARRHGRLPQTKSSQA
jgi:hypothetical protein